MFVPFVSDVRVGGDTTPKHSQQQQQQSHDGDDEETKTSAAAAPSSSETAGAGTTAISEIPTEAASEDPSSRLTPPSSPHVGKER